MKLSLVATSMAAAVCTSACCDDDVYRAPAAADVAVLPIANGSASTGWTVSNVPDGTYDLEFYTKSSSAVGQPYLTVGNRTAAIVPSPSTWSKGVARGIEVAGGTLSVALHAEGCDVQIRDLSLVASKPFALLKGGDISYLNYMEGKGAKYYAPDGAEGDCLQILAANGMNLARIRLYNDPGNKADTYAAQMPAGCQDLADCLRLARRAKEAGMQIVFSFHYSDYWTNGSDQRKPAAWADYDAEQLKRAVYEYTRDVVAQLVEQATAPEYVAIGNEIQAGMLYPEGSCNNMKDFTDMLSAASRGVREAAPQAKIILHTDKGGNLTQAKWFFGEMRNYNVDYDIIGASYYPFWVGLTASQVRDWADKVIELCPEMPEARGRLAKGAARMILLKYYMIRGQWAKAEAMARDLYAMEGQYTLQPDYMYVFSKAGIGNNEIILQIPCNLCLSSAINYMTAEALPTDMPWTEKSTGWGGYTIPWELYDTFEAGDARLQGLAASYVNTSGVAIGRADLKYGAVPVKYGRDPEMIDARSGIDVVVYRYSDVLLSLAELIVRNGGPVAGEASDLLNRVRHRAGLGDMPAASAEEFLDAILAERGREFYYEGLRRQDLIRFGRYVEYANRRIARSNAENGTAYFSVDNSHNRFPIPADFINESKSAIKQNPEY